MGTVNKAAISAFIGATATFIGHVLGGMGLQIDPDTLMAGQTIATTFFVWLIANT